MIQEDRELLLQDLCARLPYKVILNVTLKNKYDEIVNRDIELTDDNLTYITRDSHWIMFKPYLRPMSSMTEDEKHYIDYEWGADNDGDITTYSSCEGGMSIVECACIVGFQDWLIKNMFDYRGLIKRGLALEAPEGMYNNKEELQ